MIIKSEKTRLKRVWASASMPDNIAVKYSEAERAALNVIAAESSRFGTCALSIEEIGTRAGTGRSTVQNAIRKARSAGHISVEERGLMGFTNLLQATWNPVAGRG